MSNDTKQQELAKWIEERTAALSKEATELWGSMVHATVSLAMLAPSTTGDGHADCAATMTCDTYGGSLDQRIHTAAIILTSARIPKGTKPPHPIELMLAVGDVVGAMFLTSGIGGADVH